MKKGLVSIIITTRNEEKNIERCLLSIRKNTYAKKEIIVVDNNSSDATQKIARKFTELVFNFGPERSAQRNFGAKKSQGEFLLFLDADMQLSVDVISSCAQEIEKSKKIGGIVIPEISVGERFWEKVKAFERSFYNEKGDRYTDAARFFRKESFLLVGGYDESITGPEDWDLPENMQKKGFTIHRVSAHIYHYENIPDLGSLLRKKYYYGLKAHRYLEKNNISTASPKTLFFLRPVFYKNYKKFLAHPVLGVSMIIMLSGELVAGGYGFMKGKVQNL